MKLRNSTLRLRPLEKYATVLSRLPRQVGLNSISVYVTAVFFLLLLSPVDSAAQSVLEPTAPYTQTELLRDDASLRSIAFAKDGKVGIAVGDHGVILRSEDGGKSWDLQPSPVACGLVDVIWLNHQNVIAIGGQYDRITCVSRGVTLWSDDAGVSWRRGADNELPRLGSLSRREQDNAIVATGDWSAIAESREFESHDAGRSWNSTGELDGVPQVQAESKSAVRLAWVEATKSEMVIRDVYERNANELFAVGDHGVILRGDRASGLWEPIRGEQRHASILVVAKDPSSIAWSMVGSETLESHQRVAVVVQHPHTVGESSAKAEQWLCRARQAASALGAASVDTVDAAEAIETEAKNWIAIHRPAVLVIDDSLDPKTASAFSQTAISMGVSRVVRYGFDSGGESMIHRNAMMPFAGVLAGDLWDDALQIVSPESEIKDSVSLRILYDTSGNPPRGESVTTGLSLSQNQRLAASFTKANRRQLQVVQARLSESKRVEQMIQSSSTNEFFEHALKSLLNQTAASDQLRLTWSIYRRLASSDAETFPNAIAYLRIVLAESAVRFSDRSFGKWSALRLTAIESSVEWQTLHAAISRASALAANDATAPVQQAAVSPFQVESSGVALASAVSPLRVPEATPVQVGTRRVSQNNVEVDLAWEFHPLVLIAGEAARQRGDNAQLERMGQGSGNFRRLRASQSVNPWTSLITADDKGNEHPSRSQQDALVIAVPAGGRPKLDGINDDACWTRRDAPLNHETTVQIAYDDDYVFFFVSCSRDAFRHDPTTKATKKNRDYDLSRSDRLRISIDTDQDLMTAYQLQVTPSGKTHDSIDGQSGWQPTWYVATKEAAERIHFEIAVLRRDLTELPLQPGQAWFLSARVIAAGDNVSTPPIADPTLWKLTTFR
ncbi:hypothetical protein SH528x_007148 [Novipirellula sp. SH528]|uniref:hypothetical protein n=1 Tax=Novipirellula sp. SH528 TaxID=3454466 RepID=UPI003FA180E8